MPVSRLDRVFAGILWGLAVFCVAGIVHILAVFNLPKLERTDAMGRISAFVQGSDLALLPRPGPGAAWAPFSDPALAQGACLFDLTQSPMRLRGAVDGDRMLTLSFRAPAGDVFYSMTDRAAQRGHIDVLVLTADQLDTLEAGADDEAPAQELRLVAPTAKGFVLVNALAAFPGDRSEAEQRVKAISCEPEAE
jgi:uncharacterized membrane protein